MSTRENGSLARVAIGLTAGFVLASPAVASAYRLLYPPSMCTPRTSSSNHRFDNGQLQNHGTSVLEVICPIITWPNYDNPYEAVLGNPWVSVRLDHFDGSPNADVWAHACVTYDDGLNPAGGLVGGACGSWARTASAGLQPTFTGITHLDLGAAELAVWHSASPYADFAYVEVSLPAFPVGWWPSNIFGFAVQVGI